MVLGVLVKSSNARSCASVAWRFLLRSSSVPLGARCERYRSRCRSELGQGTGTRPDPAKVFKGERILEPRDRRGGREGGSREAAEPGRDSFGGCGSRLNLGRRSRPEPEAILAVSGSVAGAAARYWRLRRSRSLWNCRTTVYNLSEALSLGRSWGVRRGLLKRRIVPSAARKVPGSSGGSRGRLSDWSGC